MGHSRDEKSASHDRIVRAASARLREAGIEGIGVADLMNDAGLTHGGFYRHFASRDELVAEAVDLTFLDGMKVVDGLSAALRDGSNRTPSEKDKLKHALAERLVTLYLAAAHRDDLATSCGVTTLAGDISRSSDRIRSAYTKQAEAYIELLTKLMPSGKRGSKKARAIAALSTLVGALSMARAVNDEALSDDILKLAAAELKAQLA